MKELEINSKQKIELSVKKQKQVEYELIGNIVPHNNHSIWKINNETLEITKADYYNKNYVLGEENKKEIIVIKGYTYISALNKKNALKKFKQGVDGSKPFSDEPLPLGF